MIQDGNSVVSVHEWIQPTHEKTPMPNSERIIKPTMELGLDLDLKQSRKSQNAPVLPSSLHNDPRWQQCGFSS